MGRVVLGRFPGSIKNYTLNREPLFRPFQLYRTYTVIKVIYKLVMPKS